MMPALALALAGCEKIYLPIHSASGQVQEESVVRQDLVKIGVVADAQLQTRANNAHVPGYRGPDEDRVVHVSIRPPALDWAARSLLRAELARQKAAGAKAIFFLGDGANNGCYDEFEQGFTQPGADPTVMPNDQGVLTLLDQFRKDNDIPVYFVLGNHDVLGAGSTPAINPRTSLCEDQRDALPPGHVRNHPLTKRDVIALVDRFNRANNTLHPEWRYRSNFDTDPNHAANLANWCGTDAAAQVFRAGCYLAAIVEYRVAPGRRTEETGRIEFLLLDANDWRDVWKPLVRGYRQLGSRGAMTFVDLPGIQSQAAWFRGQSLAASPAGAPADRAEFRVALSHYDLQGLKAQLFHVKFSSKTQRFMDLFLDHAGAATSPWAYNQNAAFFISAHTHTETYRAETFPYVAPCTGHGASRRCPTEQPAIAELNIGSTTDYSNYATVVTLGRTEEGMGSLRYRRIAPEAKSCRDVFGDILTYPFPAAFTDVRSGVSGAMTGWNAIGINRPTPVAYGYYDFAQAQLIWRNLDDFTKTPDQANVEDLAKAAHRANCIGLYAAALEAGRVDPE